MTCLIRDAALKALGLTEKSTSQAVVRAILQRKFGEDLYNNPEVLFHPDAKYSIQPRYIFTLEEFEALKDKLRNVNEWMTPEQAKQMRRVIRSRIQPNYQQMDMIANVLLMREYQQLRSFYLTAMVGLGKTTIACWLMIYLISTGQMSLCRIFAPLGMTGQWVSKLVYFGLKREIAESIVYSTTIGRTSARPSARASKDGKRNSSRSSGRSSASRRAAEEFVVDGQPTEELLELIRVGTIFIIDEMHNASNDKSNTGSFFTTIIQTIREYTATNDDSARNASMVFMCSATPWSTVEHMYTCTENHLGACVRTSARCGMRLPSADAKPGKYNSTPQRLIVYVGKFWPEFERAAMDCASQLKSCPGWYAARLFAGLYFTSVHDLPSEHLYRPEQVSFTREEICMNNWPHFMDDERERLNVAIVALNRGMDNFAHNGDIIKSNALTALGNVTEVAVYTWMVKMIDVLNQPDCRKVVAIVPRRNLLAQLEAAFDYFGYNILKIDGDQDIDARDEAIQLFSVNSDEHRIMLLSMSVAEGISLGRVMNSDELDKMSHMYCRTVLIAPDFSLRKMIQSGGRGYRPGDGDASNGSEVIIIYPSDSSDPTDDDISVNVAVRDAEDKMSIFGNCGIYEVNQNLVSNELEQVIYSFGNFPCIDAKLVEKLKKLRSEDGKVARKHATKDQILSPSERCRKMAMMNSVYDVNLGRFKTAAEIADSLGIDYQEDSDRASVSSRASSRTSGSMRAAVTKRGSSRRTVHEEESDDE